MVMTILPLPRLCHLLLLLALLLLLPPLLLLPLLPTIATTHLSLLLLLPNIATLAIEARVQPISQPAALHVRAVLVRSVPWRPQSRLKLADGSVG